MIPMPVFTKKSRMILCAMLATVILCGGRAHSRFLLDEDTTPKTTAEVKEAEKKQRREFPSYVVTSIKATLIPDIKGAVRITWEADPDATEKFIIGRSREVPDTRDKALAAITIGKVAPGADTTVIDSNLQPGEYYYVILSEDRVVSRTVDLYPDVNFTSQPVIVEKEITPAPLRLTPEQVTLIHAQVVNKNQVMVTWRGLDKPDTIYTVYRGTEPLTNPEKVRNADRIAVITEKRESWIDRTVTRTATYFFAVTTRDIAGNEDLQLVPDQSFTTGGVYIGFKAQVTVANLRAVLQEANRVRLTWDGISSAVSEYLVYRFDRPIVDSQRLALATLLGSVKSDVNFYADEVLQPGSYYYAVLVRLEDGTIDNTLREGGNYTINPMGVGGRGTARTDETRTQPLDTRIEEKKTAPSDEGRKVPVSPARRTGTLDEILRQGFFKGEYRYTVKRLKQYAAESPDPYEAAKARLFIGRSYIELGEYERSLKYLVRPDVARFFPEEARFWREFALSRVK